MQFGADEAAAGQLIASTLTSSISRNGGIPAGNDCQPRNLIFGGGANCQRTDVATALSAHPGGTRMDAETETFIVAGRCRQTVRRLAAPRSRTPRTACWWCTEPKTPDVLRGLAHPLGRNSGQENALLAFSCKDHGADAGDLAPTLRAMGHGASHANAGGQIAVQEPNGVRRLTPRECEWLQGFPGDHTRIPYRGKPAYECPDGPRYQAIGNSKAVPVVRWIGQRLQQQIERSA